MAVRKLYKITRELKQNETYAPQALKIVEAIKANGEPIERTTLLETLEKSGVLNSKQSVSRVFSFFRPKLMGNGLMKEVKETIADPATAATPKRAAKKSSGSKTSRAKKVS
jgi:hypothetical protein